jgi:hypothetical protein
MTWVSTDNLIRQALDDKAYSARAIAGTVAQGVIFD